MDRLNKASETILTEGRQRTGSRFLEWMVRHFQSSSRRTPILVVALLVGVWAGCREPVQPLRVGCNMWPGYEPLHLAQELGLYDQHSVQVIRFPSATEVIRAYRNRVIDVAAVTADEALLVAETQPDQRIILVLDFSKGADAIIANPKFPSMNALRGHRIGLEPNALGAYMLARALETAGMAVSNVVVVPVGLESHEVSLLSNRVDAIVTFEPRRSRLLAAGMISVFDSSRIPGEIVDVLLTHEELTRSNRKELRGLLHGWFRALNYMKGNPGDAIARLARRERMNPSEFQKLLADLDLPDRAANLGLLGSATNSLRGTLKRLSDEMISHKLMENAVDPSRILDPTLVESLHR
jgi:NitT/TauT family transport system substrate-binding protein